MWHARQEFLRRSGTRAQPAADRALWCRSPARDWRPSNCHPSGSTHIRWPLTPTADRRWLHPRRACRAYCRRADAGVELDKRAESAIRVASVPALRFPGTAARNQPGESRAQPAHRRPIRQGRDSLRCSWERLFAGREEALQACPASFLAPLWGSPDQRRLEILHDECMTNDQGPPVPEHWSPCIYCRAL